MSSVKAIPLRERTQSETRAVVLRAEPAAHPAPDARCADRLLDVLEAAGVDTVYGVPGGAISPIYDALIDHPSIRVVHVRHETSALFMAVGHTRLRPGSLPCVLVTSGPGVTNALTGLASAYGENAPVVVIAGEVPRSKFGRRALQEGSAETIDVVNMVRSVTRSAQCATSPGMAVFQLRSALQEARSRRGPVFLSLPLDVAVAPAAHPTFTPAAPVPAALDPAALRAAAEALLGASTPLVLVGSGARGAAGAIAELAESLDLPVITSPKGKGVVPESAPYCLGAFGYGGHPSAAEWLHRNPPDVVLALGCGLNETSTNSWSPLLQASRTMIQVDLDASQFGRNYRTDIAFEADCAEALAALRPLLAKRLGSVPVTDGVARLPLEPIRPGAALDPAHVISILQEELPAGTVYTSDIGEHLLYAIHHLRPAGPDEFIASLTLGSMGSGIGAAIGAKHAAPERTTVAICGDYGFQMYGIELATCVQEGLGVVFAVLNDGRMRMVEAGVARIYGRGLRMDGPRVDFAALAAAHGAIGVRVDTADDLRRALRERCDDRPTVLDIRIDPGARFPVNPRVAEISNFTAR